MEEATRGQPIQLAQLCLGRNPMLSVPHGEIKLPW